MTARQMWLLDPTGLLASVLREFRPITVCDPCVGAGRTLLAAAEAGATAVIQPGGSMRVDEVIAAADAAGLAMVFTGMRHFRH